MVQHLQLLKSCAVMCNLAANVVGDASRTLAGTSKPHRTTKASLPVTSLHHTALTPNPSGSK